MIETYVIPIKIETEGNKIEHWSKKYLRRKKLKTAIRAFVNGTMIRPPCIVVLTRIAPRKLDKEDNLPAAMKWAKDAVAEILIPGLVPGRADEDNRIEWRFDQMKGKVRQYALGIQIIS